MSNKYYDQLLNANFASDYKTRIGINPADLQLTRLRSACVFEANPQYAQDWANITSGGKSAAYSTDGTSLIKTNFDSMSPQAAQHYAQNPYDLLAAEGFGHDPTLQYQALLRRRFWHTKPANHQHVFVDAAKQVDSRRHSGWRKITQQHSPIPRSALAHHPTAPQLVWRQHQHPERGEQQQPHLMGGGGSVWWRWWRRLYGGGTTGGSASSSGGSMSFNPTMNPYLQQMGDMMAGTMTNNWQRKVQPQIASQSIAAGGYGGLARGCRGKFGKRLEHGHWLCPIKPVRPRLRPGPEPRPGPAEPLAWGMPTRPQHQ